MDRDARGVLQYLGFMLSDIGLGQKLLRRSNPDGTWTYIHCDNPSRVPTRLDEGVVYIDVWESGRKVSTRHSATLAHALLELYGPCEGDPLPTGLQVLEPWRG